MANSTVSCKAIPARDNGACSEQIRGTCRRPFRSFAAHSVSLRVATDRHRPRLRLHRRCDASIAASVESFSDRQSIRMLSKLTRKASTESRPVSISSPFFGTRIRNDRFGTPDARLMRRSVSSLLLPATSKGCRCLSDDSSRASANSLQRPRLCNRSESITSVRRPVWRASSTANNWATLAAPSPADADANAIAAPSRSFCDPFCRFASNNCRLCCL